VLLSLIAVFDWICGNMAVDQAYILYNATTMLSQLETNLFIIFRSQFHLIEVACHVIGIREDVIYLYLDYQKLLPFLPNDIGKDKSEEQRSQLRINVIVDCLLKSLVLNTDRYNPLGWILSVRKGTMLEATVSSNPVDLSKQPNTQSIDVSSVVSTAPPEGMEPFDVYK
jgi:hypothetical protein